MFLSLYSVIGIGLIASCLHSCAPIQKGADTQARAPVDETTDTLQAIASSRKIQAGRTLPARPHSVHVDFEQWAISLGCTQAATAEPATYSLSISVDPRYTQTNDWEQRLQTTMMCVNALYQQVGIVWDVVDLALWDGAIHRENLYAALDALQKNRRQTSTAVYSLGIVKWSDELVYRMRGGREIGLSQGTSCVVPSWPRVENDCLILAHELGHLIGAVHVPGKHYIMGPATATLYLPVKDPIQRVLQTWRFHPRNIWAIKAYRSGEILHDRLTPSRPCETFIAQLDNYFFPAQ